MKTIAQALVDQLQAQGVDLVFGIPGVHTLELYRALEAAGMRHVSPRHEQGAGFMADGYARVSGRPGVAFVITGPGASNMLTPMAQARADSVPMLVISSANPNATLGQGLGCLHELPDQQTMMATVALSSQEVQKASDVAPMVAAAFEKCRAHRGGPVHLQIPLDIAGLPYEEEQQPSPASMSHEIEPNAFGQAASLLQNAQSPVILVGGGAKHASEQLIPLAERLGSPVIQTVNARGVMFDHPLGVPASPSLNAVRELIEAADVVLAVGTELGATDYDMYATGSMPKMANLIRVDICPEQLTRHDAELTIQGESRAALETLNQALDRSSPAQNGWALAQKTRAAAWEEIGPEMRKGVRILEAIRKAIPQAVLVGDSTQLAYAGNLYYDHDRAGGWFNAATGYGALGYAIPAACGAALADITAEVICISGDGGAQFSFAEMMCASEESLPISFVIWNNEGYQEIATSMQAAGINVMGCDPKPPHFEYLAKSFNMPFWQVPADENEIAQALLNARTTQGPRLIEVKT